MRGRKPKPTRILKFEGNPGHRSKKRLKDIEVQPGLPECPDWIKGTAKTEWDRVIPILDGMGLITKADLAAIVCYCLAYATLQSEQKKKDSKDRNLNIKNAMAMIKGFCIEFGMTPSSRGRMSLKSKEKDPDGMGALLTGVRQGESRPGS